MAVAAEIDLFFDDPSEYHAPPRQYSNLYLLRRDIDYCLGINRKTGADSPCAALFLGTVGILAGIDLLAKFREGKDSTGIGEVGNRFRDYIAKNFPNVAPGNPHLLYQLRNSLIHSYGLYSKDKTHKYHFKLGWVSGAVVTSEPNDIYVVAVKTLYRDFEHSINDYRTKLIGDSTLQKNFSKMFPYYGSIFYGPV
jgi:hypothetical protein